MKWIAEGRYSHSGTYNANVVAMAAVNASLEELKKPGVYENLFAQGNRLMGGLQLRFDQAGIPVQVQGIGPVFQVWFADQPVRSWREAATHAQHNFFRIFWEEMFVRGVLFHPNQFENFFMATAHHDEHIDATLAALDDAMPVLKQRFSESLA